MRLGFISAVNGAAVAVLLIIHWLAARKRPEGAFKGRRWLTILSELTLYVCAALMILPIGVRGWKFGFSSVLEMLIWAVLTAATPLACALLQAGKRSGKTGARFASALLPAALFALNGVLLRHGWLLGAAALFAACRFALLREHARSQPRSAEA